MFTPPLAGGARQKKVSFLLSPFLSYNWAANAPLAQLDRASVSGTEGCRFESCAGYQI